MKVDKNQIAQNEIAHRLGLAIMEAILKQTEIMELQQKVQDLQGKLAELETKAATPES